MWVGAASRTLVTLWCLVVTVQYASAWSYLHEEDWRWDCQQREESPVNIDTGSTVYEPRLASLTFKNYGLTRGVQLSMVNNGHTLEVFVRSEPRHNISISSDALPGGNYKLEQLHFHWGNSSASGSEHTVNGGAYPLELHLVHWNVAYGSIQEAIHHGDGLAVLAVFFTLTGPPRHTVSRVPNGIEHIMEHIRRPELRLPNQGEVKVRPFRMSTLLPERDPGTGTRPYYRYHGSLTTPPCTEDVLWHVFRRPATISEAYLNNFRQLVNVDNERMVANHRRVQPLHRRTVYRSAREEDEGSGAVQNQVTCHLLRLILPLLLLTALA